MRHWNHRFGYSHFGHRPFGGYYHPPFADYGAYGYNGYLPYAPIY